MLRYDQIFGTSDSQVCAPSPCWELIGQQCDNDVNEGLSRFRIKLMVGLQDITQNMFCNLVKISHPANLEIC